jgi:hypothetical protein
MKNKLASTNFTQWNEAHVNYDLYDHDICLNGDKIKYDECEWRKKLIEESPNGDLLLRNSFFETIKNKNKIYLAHATPNFRNIRKDNLFFPSSGCLVASIYCTPLTEDSNGLRLHNLGDYIITKEMPAFVKNMQNCDPRNLDTVLFEIEIPAPGKGNLIGTDYLRLGDIHFETYKELEYLLSYQEKSMIHQSCSSQIRKGLKFLSIANLVYRDNYQISAKNFLKIFVDAIEKLPFLGYFYFEVLSEYIMLYQDNQESVFFKEKGEFYSPSYKDLMFSLSSNLLKHYSLTQFKPDVSEVVEHLLANKVFNNLNQESMEDYLTKRLIFLTNARMFNKESKLIDWENISWDFEGLSKVMKPLIGHLIHRELRSFGRYPDFYFYFDQLKALRIWNYWNQIDLVVPFNGIMPKGEVGINPAFPELKYKSFLAKYYSVDGRGYLEPGEELGLNIIPRLVDPRFTAMGENKKNL